MKNCPVAVALAVISSAPCFNSATAGSIVAPNALEDVAGNSNSARVLRGEAYTYQMQIAGSQLLDMTVGQLITGLAFRVDGSFATWTSDVTYSDFEISLSQAANAFGSISTTYSANMTSPTLVMDGALTIPANTFSNGNNPNPFGYTLSFDTPYAYQGGNLVIHITHTVSDGPNLTLDAANSATTGYGTAFYAQYSSGFKSTTATTTSGAFAVTRIDFASVPEPSGFALFALGLLGFRFSQGVKRT